jgi:hypothetical protein
LFAAVKNNSEEYASATGGSGFGVLSSSLQAVHKVIAAIAAIDINFKFIVFILFSLIKSLE